MRLLITDPLHVVADHADVVSLRAEDDSGGFGILPGHADFLTALAVSVVSWRHADGREGFCAVQRGVLTVHDRGREVAIATRQAVLGASLPGLEHDVLARMRERDDAGRKQRTEVARLHLKAVREIVRLLQPRPAPVPGGTA